MRCRVSDVPIPYQKFLLLDRFRPSSVTDNLRGKGPILDYEMKLFHEELAHVMCVT